MPITPLACIETTPTDPTIEVFSTCPVSGGAGRQEFLQKVTDLARWSEEAGCKGILVYADNSLLDAWMVCQVILENTEHLCPLPAIQPVYMHPYSVAKSVTTLAYLYGRRRT